MLKIIVCDDEVVFLNKITKIIRQEFSKHNIDIEIDSFLSGEKLIEKNDIHDFKLIFLDIEIKDINGIEVAKILRNRGYEGTIIFITSYMDYTICGYEAEAFRYILKDNLDYALKECVVSVIYKLGLNKFCFGELSVNVKEIIYIESDNHKLIFHLKNNKTYECWGKLSDVEKSNKHLELIRIHQSYMINTIYLKGIKRYFVTLVDEIQIPVPKQRYNNVKDEIKVRKVLWN